MKKSRVVKENGVRENGGTEDEEKREKTVHGFYFSVSTGESREHVEGSELSGAHKMD